MHTAVRSMSINLVKYFAEQGVKWTEKNTNGMTAVELAAKVENEQISMEMVGFMLSKTKKRHLLGIGEKIMQICLILLGGICCIDCILLLTAVNGQRRAIYNFGISSFISFI